MTAPDPDRPIRRAALTAGVGLLVMSALAALANLVALDGLIDLGDAARTAAAITESEGVFRLAIVGLFAVIALEVIVAWATSPGYWASCSPSPASATSSTASAPPSSETPGATCTGTPSSGSSCWRSGS